MILLAGYGGLRFGEAAGLRIRCLRLFEPKVDIVEGLVEVGSELLFGPLKTAGSRRTITIPTFLNGRAGGTPRHLAGSRRIRSRVQRGARRRDPPNELATTHLGPGIEAAGILPTLTFHHLRHTAAAIAIAEGAHPRAIQTRLGHASITTTLGIYGGLFPSLDEDLADRMDASYRAAAERRPKVSGVDSTGVVRDAHAARVRHAAVMPQ